MSQPWPILTRLAIVPVPVGVASCTHRGGMPVAASGRTC